MVQKGPCCNGNLFRILVLLGAYVADAASWVPHFSHLHLRSKVNKAFAHQAADLQLEDHTTFSGITGISPELPILLHSHAREVLSQKISETPEDVTDEVAGDLTKAAKKAEKAEKEVESVQKDELKEAAKVEAVKPVEGEVAKETEEIGKSAAEITGVRPNKHGDVNTAIATWSINSGLVVLVIIVFSGLRTIFPMIYSYEIGNHTRSGVGKLNNSFAGWISASWSIKRESVAKHEGLDAAMLLLYCEMCMKLLATIGIPMVCIMCPLHYFFGGDAAIDELSKIAMGNVIVHHPWLYYVHALVVNMVTVTIVNAVYSSMSTLLKMRSTWLKKLPKPRCNTVLVTGIPLEWRSDAQLWKYFATVFPHRGLKEATMVKDAPELLAAYQEAEGYKRELECAQDTLREALKDLSIDDLQAKAYQLSPEEDVSQKTSEELIEFLCESELHPQEHGAFLSSIVSQMTSEISQNMNAPAHLDWRPNLRDPPCIGRKQDAITYNKEALVALKLKLIQLRQSAAIQADEVGGINTASAFLTFQARREAEICHNLTMTAELDQWQMHVPPPVQDVRWNDLKPSKEQRSIFEMIARVLLCVLYIIYIPITCLGTNLATFVHMGYFQPYWEAFAPGLALMLFLAFLPTIFLLIFRSFFTLVSDTFAQHKLQIWYTYFMVFFVILVTIIGKSIVDTLSRIAGNPDIIFTLMAENMPTATHFYMDFLMIQWWDQAKGLLRMMQIVKYVVFRYLPIFDYTPEDAKPMAEPEDQDFDGIGARLSRLTVALMIGIIFSTLSPLIAILAMIFFFIARTTFGYLIVYAETRKPDLGGVFFHTQLIHMLFGTLIYNCLMIGVLMFRAKTKAPMIIAIPAMFYTIYCLHHFTTNFVWQSLPFEEVVFKGDDEELEELVTNEFGVLRWCQTSSGSALIHWFASVDYDENRAKWWDKDKQAWAISGFDGLPTTMDEFEALPLATALQIKEMTGQPGMLETTGAELSSSKDLDTGLSYKQKEFEDPGDRENSRLSSTGAPSRQFTGA